MRKGLEILRTQDPQGERPPKAKEESVQATATSEVDATWEGEDVVTTVEGGMTSIAGAISRGVATSPYVAGRGGDPTVFAFKSTMGMGASGVEGGAGWAGRVGVASRDKISKFLD